MQTALERFTSCRGWDVAKIAEAFADVEQDDVTRSLVQLFAERTDAGRLPALPYRVRLSMFGDTDVSEWRIDYGSDEYSVTEASVDEYDTEMRWEHWEDGVRLVNGDVQALALLFARRVTVEDEQSTMSEPMWFRAVDFAPGSQAQSDVRVLTRLVEAHERDARSEASYVAEVGVERIVEARALIVARALVEAGCAEDLKGSFMQVTSAEDGWSVVVDIGMTGVQIADASHLPSAGVDLQYATTEAMLAEATGARTFQNLLVNGLIKVEGDDDSKARFARTLMSFARLHGI
jgi:hypothetical protein